jgi:Metallo-peptidase family M12/Disintegrin
MRHFRCLASLLANALFFAGQIDGKTKNAEPSIHHADTNAAHSQARNALDYLSLIENARIQTPSHRVHAFSSFDLTFDLHKNSQRIKLSLEPNHDILGQDSHVEYLDTDGNVRHSERISREDHKVFQGKAWLHGSDGHWENVGWSRIMIRRDGIHPLFEGAFSLSGDHHHIQLSSSYMRTKHLLDPALEDSDDEYMACFRDSDARGEPRTELRRRNTDRSCVADELPFNSDPNHPVFQTPVLKREEGYWGSMPLTSLLSRRQIDGNIPGGGNSAGTNLRSTIGQSDGCPTTRKVALVGVATDCSYTGSFNSSESVRANVIQQFNTASELYQSTFNITLGLRNLTVSDAECPGTPPAAAPWNIGCPSPTTIDERLNLFSTWRGQRNDNNAYWTLLAGPDCNTGAEVGLAWLGQLCNTQVTSGQDTTGSNQTVTGANVVVRTSQEWQVIAHESGHTFGAVHDCDASACANSQVINAQQCCPASANGCDANGAFIMNPSSSQGVGKFSACTIGNICSALGRNSVKSDCLSDNRGVQTISGSQCGNGIVEDGEDCDCGGTDGCAGNSCCEAATCKFQSGAVCDDSNEGCCQGCRFAASGTVCRASTGTCDPEETCPGDNGNCPADETAADGSGCGKKGDNLQCASGQCTSRDQQCKTLMAAYSANNDTYACNSQTCSVSCASPEFGPNVCYSMQQNFLDGTPCGGGGKCGNVRSSLPGRFTLFQH